jgi:diadenosine tetraphosphate (Ap4A) HIT family hydrolase
VDCFELHPRLAADTVRVGDLPLCRVLLMNDCRYPWLILVPRRCGIRELYELAQDDRQQLMTESCAAGLVLQRGCAADKLNVAALGNLVPQLHLHHVARFRSDPAWPGPVWGHSPAQPYAPDESQRVLRELREALTPYALVAAESEAAHRQ